jgi:hypothetical protein
MWKSLCARANPLAESLHWRGVAGVARKSGTADEAPERAKASDSRFQLISFGGLG